MSGSFLSFICQGDGAREQWTVAYALLSQLPNTLAATRSRAAVAAQPSSAFCSATCPVISPSCVATVDSLAGTPSKLSRI